VVDYIFSVPIATKKLSVREKIYRRGKQYCALTAYCIYTKIALFPDAIALSPDAIALFPDAIALSPDAIALSPDTIKLFPDTIALSLDAMALFPDAMALSLDASP
jgi:hypothetical protein